MANIQDPNTPANVMAVDGSFKSARVSLRPLDATVSQGSYQQGLFTGTMAAALAANSEVMQFRYTGANICVVNQVTFEGLAANVAFAAGALNFRLLVAQAWTVDGSGGNVAAVTTEATQLDSQYTAPTATLRVASTAALGAGTKTLQGVTANSQGIGLAIGFTAPAVPAVGQQMPKDSNFFHTSAAYDHPQILRNNEGLVVVANVPATGTWITGFTISWTEMLAATWR